MEKAAGADITVPSNSPPLQNHGPGDLINASGHRQELDRNFSLINICGLGLTTGNTWIALGGSIVCISLTYVHLFFHQYRSPLLRVI
jgi:choline transport protein